MTDAPTVDRVSIVHGDYRAGNFLFSPTTLQISAILDWELAFLGDRHADLAYVIDPLFSEHGETGETLVRGCHAPLITAAAPAATRISMSTQADLVPGHTMSIRLLSPVSSDGSRTGDPMEGVVTYPLCNYGEWMACKPGSLRMAASARGAKRNSSSRLPACRVY